jgi:hypothetical protein
MSLWNNSFHGTTLDDAFSSSSAVSGNGDPDWGGGGGIGTSIQHAFPRVQNVPRTGISGRQIFRGRELVYDSRIPTQKSDREVIILTKSVISRKLLPEEDSDCCITLEPIAESGKYVQCKTCHKVLDISAFSAYIFSNPILLMKPICPHCRQTFPIPAQVFQNQDSETSPEKPSIFVKAITNLIHYQKEEEKEECL